MHIVFHVEAIHGNRYFLLMIKTDAYLQGLKLIALGMIRMPNTVNTCGAKL